MHTEFLKCQAVPFAPMSAHVARTLLQIIIAAQCPLQTVFLQNMLNRKRFQRTRDSDNVTRVWCLSFVLLCTGARLDWQAPFVQRRLVRSIIVISSSTSNKTLLPIAKTAFTYLYADSTVSAFPTQNRTLSAARTANENLASSFRLR